MLQLVGLLIYWAWLLSVSACRTVSIVQWSLEKGYSGRAVAGFASMAAGCFTWPGAKHVEYLAFIRHVRAKQLLLGKRRVECQPRPRNFERFRVCRAFGGALAVPQRRRPAVGAIRNRQGGRALVDEPAAAKINHDGQSVDPGSMEPWGEISVTDW